jgi:cell division protease FtsH
MDDDVARFATTFQRFMEHMSQAAASENASPFREEIARHVGGDVSTMPVVVETFAAYDHPNVQVAIDAYVEAGRRRHRLIGLSGQQRRWMSLADLVQHAHQTGVGMGSVDYANLPVSPDDTLACVAFGCYLIEDGDRRFAVLMRAGDEQRGSSDIAMEVLAPEDGWARAFFAEIRELMVERNVFRGQVVSFGRSYMGEMGVGPMVFHRRQPLARDEIVLADGVLDRIERQIFGVERHRDRLREAGQHVRRGLLLHGPPGNGKTLLVRYVAATARHHTVVILTGAGLGMIQAASSLARMLQPAVVVLEDVDLVAEMREHYPGGNPFLFQVLNEMDGVLEDADIVYLLTTNRADLLEPALAARPGRVDLAVAIDRPGPEQRRRLIEVYSGDVSARLREIDEVVARTDGVAAAFLKELMRKAALFAAMRDEADGRLVVDDDDVMGALEELLEEGNALTRALLGADGSTDVDEG